MGPHTGTFLYQVQERRQPWRPGRRRQRHTQRSRERSASLLPRRTRLLLEYCPSIAQKRKPTRVYSCIVFLYIGRLKFPCFVSAFALIPFMPFY